ncbi:MAG: WD40/YVTN/BNR-like repeat-containing protein [Candidatus Dormibacteraceae bacterium]
MRGLFGSLPSRWAAFAVPPLIALLIGVTVAIASSPTSLTRARGGGTTTVDGGPSPSPADSSPLPSVTSPGVLGDGAHLEVGGSGVLIGLARNLAEESSDGGKTWTSLRPASNGSGIAVDAADPRHAITGGSLVQVTADGGASWRTSRTRPPGSGEYQPLQISPFDNAVWFLIYQQRLLRTRDASVSWRELTGLPPLATPVIAPGTVFGQFFLASGNRVFELVDNGQRILELAALPQGVTVTDLAVVAGDPPTLLARGGKDSAYLLKGNAWSVAGGGLNGPVAVGANGVLLVGNGGAKLGSPGAISYSIDAGTTWSPAIGLPYDQSVEAIAAQPKSSALYAYCYGGDIYTSSDGGRAWTVLTRGLRTTTG